MELRFLVQEIPQVLPIADPRRRPVRNDRSGGEVEDRVGDERHDVDGGREEGLEAGAQSDAGGDAAGPFDRTLLELRLSGVVEVDGLQKEAKAVDRSAVADFENARIERFWTGAADGVEDLLLLELLLMS